jgi:hypothetical protein
MSQPACLIVAALTLIPLASAAIAEQAKPETTASDVSVTVKYTGKGAVDPTHQIWVWLFDNPDVGAGSIPIAEEAISKNGATARFTNVSTKPVYIAVAYDEKGGFAGQAPPPPGSPIALYGVTGPETKPQPVTPGPKGSISIAFNDAQRMQ